MDLLRKIKYQKYCVLLDLKNNIEIVLKDLLFAITLLNKTKFSEALLELQRNYVK